MKRLINRLSNERGASMAEYGLLLVLIAVVAIAAFTSTDWWKHIHFPFQTVQVAHADFCRDRCPATATATPTATPSPTPTAVQFPPSPTQVIGEITYQLPARCPRSVAEAEVTIGAPGHWSAVSNTTLQFDPGPEHISVSFRIPQQTQVVGDLLVFGPGAYLTMGGRATMYCLDVTTATATPTQTPTATCPRNRCGR